MSGKYNRKDHLYTKAKEEGFRGRASYKLLELQKKYRLLRRGGSVLDLGCFPGGWLQVAAEKVGPQGRVVGIDLKGIEDLSNAGRGDYNNVVALVGDMREEDSLRRIRELSPDGFDAVISDMSPALSGIRFRDAFLSAELVGIAFQTAEQLLKDGGSFVAKIFPGEEADELFQMMKSRFVRLERVELGSTRKTSSEFYLVGVSFIPLPR